jgi:transposase
VTLLLRKQRTPDRIEGREPLDWRDENYAILDGTKASPIYTQRIHGEMKWACARLKTVPGSRPITSSVRVAAIGTGDVFSKGRDFAAWLGLVPRQIWTGDCANIQARQSLPARPIRAGGLGGAGQTAELGAPWAQTVSCQDAMHRNLLAIALTNKLASIA